MSIESTQLAGAAGQLELLYSLPSTPEKTKPPLLFVHGSFCSANDYGFLLPYLARHGFASYAVSLRGHGASASQGWFGRMVLTSLDSWVADVQVALRYVAEVHADAPPPVLAGHSLGGGVVQYLVTSSAQSKPAESAEPSPPALQLSGLILLAATPLAGGSEIMTNWETIEAPDGYLYPWSERCVLKTIGQVRKAFFSVETDDATVRTWLEKCKTAEESARAGLSVHWRFGEADIILDALVGLKGSSTRVRKILCVAGGADKLVPPKMVEGNLVEYELAGGDEREQCLKLVVEGSGHHVMMDAHWESCAQGIVNWLGGEEL